ncbi:MAG TPA: 7-cyano-7-deazaguanine synthase [Terriglobales bacterium]|nr:7-cyano-7-deazaguanine synthase [Terriglobales bacterium]
MIELQKAPLPPPAIGIDVAEKGGATKKGSLRCEIGEQIEFSTARLETYCFAEWEPIVYDALLVAAAVEIGDRTLRRPAMKWERNIELTVPVHDPERWSDKNVTNALHSALDFLTGDRWQIAFRKRRKPVEPPVQGQLSLPEGLTAVIPFSDGLDSRIVAGLMARELGDKLIRVRLGSKTADARRLPRRHPFTSVPYRVRPGARDFVESSARSRGFKFALLSGIAAYLAKAGLIVVPESGQGALGPALVTVGQAYEDYRSHPLYTDRMEVFLAALLGHQVRFQFPRLWHTKGETLAKFIKECDGASGWQDTWSCWQQTRQVSVDKKKRQCGICAACMLRRMSVHAVGLTEPTHTYVWENLASASFNDGAAPSFPRKKITGKLRQYAIAGALHLDHLAGLPSSPANKHTLNLTAYQLGKSLNLPQADVGQKLVRMLTQHGHEWKNFTLGLGRNSFIADWAIHAS